MKPKQIFLLFLLLVSTAAIISCDDIIDSDDNINKTKIEYDYVVTNQENSVILPLRVGNRWLYNVTEYDWRGGIDTQYYASIVVEKDTIIHNERWFYVRGWCGGADISILLTNTNVGLWFKCEPCGDSFLEAQYPKVRNPYFSGEISSFVLTGEDSLLTDTVLRWARYEEVAQLEVPYGIYDCTKYTDRIEYKITEKRYDPYQSMYFVPDLGLIKYEKYSYGANPTIEKVYELVSHNLDGEKPAVFRQNVFEITLDSIEQRVPILFTFDDVLTNISQQNASILSITIGETNMNLNVINDNFPIVIAPGASFTLVIEATARLQGKLFGTITINAGSGEYEISMIGIG